MKPSSFSVRMDERIILTMFLFCVFACFITAFRYKNDKPCESVDFSVTANDYKVDRYISFSAISNRNADSWQWDFGDKTPIDKSSGPYTTHIYKQAGDYEITLTINGKCTQIKKININTIFKDTLPSVIPQVIWPADPILVGQNVMFRDMTNGANRWEWYIGEGKDSKQILTKDAQFAFANPGNYIVKLFINGNHDSKIEKIIRVNQTPRPSLPRQINNNPPPYEPPIERGDRTGEIQKAPRG